MASEEKTSSFLKSLFAGDVRQEMISPYPTMRPEERDDLRVIVESFREFARDHIKSTEIDRQGHIPKEVFQGLKELGFFGLAIPQEYGGAGLSQTAYFRVF